MLIVLSGVEHMLNALPGSVEELSFSVQFAPSVVSERMWGALVQISAAKALHFPIFVRYDFFAETVSSVEHPRPVHWIPTPGDASLKE